MPTTKTQRLESYYCGAASTSTTKRTAQFRRTRKISDTEKRYWQARTDIYTSTLDRLDDGYWTVISENGELLACHPLYTGGQYKALVSFGLNL